MALPVVIKGGRNYITLVLDKEMDFSELLKKIKAEKAELVKQGKIKKDKQESYIFKGDDNRHYEQIGSETKDITDEINSLYNFITNRKVNYKI